MDELEQRRVDILVGNLEYLRRDAAAEEMDTWNIRFQARIRKEQAEAYELGLRATCYSAENTGPAAGRMAYIRGRALSALTLAAVRAVPDLRSTSVLDSLMVSAGVWAS